MKRTIQTRQSRVLLSTVANFAGVSTATVSRFLNDPDTVRHERRERVRKAIETLGYIPDGRARALASRRSSIVGAIVPTLQNDRFVGALHRFQTKLHQLGGTLLIGSSNYDPEVESYEVAAMVSQGVAAIMLVGAQRPEKTYRLLRDRDIPYANAWSTDFDSGHPSFGVDLNGVYKTVLKRFASAGCKSLGIVLASSKNNDRALGRINAIRLAASEMSLRLSDRNIIECENSIEAGRLGARSLLRGAERPDAVICGTDIFALATIIEARSQNIRIPEELLVIGNADSDFSRHLSPSISTLTTPDVALMEDTAVYLWARSRGMPATANKVYVPSPVWRESTGFIQS